jgi:hypothetical protein
MSAPPEADVDRLQRWLQAVITHPGGVTAGVASGSAQSAVPITADRIADVVTASARLTASERVAIYSRSYHARLLECLRAMYPALRHALGDELFVKFVADYLQAWPPTSYTLNDLSASFPRHLAQTRPDAALPPDQREPWPDFLVDLATLERAYHEVYDGPGTEEMKTPDRASILELPDAALLALRPVLSPALRLLVFRYPVHEYRGAVLAGDSPPPPEPSTTGLAVVRRHFRVRFRLMTPEHVACAGACDGRRRVDEAFAGWTQDSATIRAALIDWLDWGLFAQLPE